VNPSSPIPTAIWQLLFLLTVLGFGYGFAKDLLAWWRRRGSADER
jgi:hypothetical protein